MLNIDVRGLTESEVVYLIYANEDHGPLVRESGYKLLKMGNKYPTYTQFLTDALKLHSIEHQEEIEQAVTRRAVM